MQIIKTVEEVRAQVKAWQREGLSVGFVPTMGYLHEGHISLMERAVKENEKTVGSIFVNPIQFGPNEDLVSYPRNLERDAAMCEEAGIDLIFHPDEKEMYSSDFCTYVDMDGITEVLCGRSRPGHFRGVCTVVNKLFQIITPDKAYFGEKDAQQLSIIKRMVRDLNIDVEIIACPIVREEDGLAMSSRNTYLSAGEREAALVINRTLKLGQTIAEQGERHAEIILERMKENLAQEPLAKVDYIEICDSLSLEPMDRLAGEVLIAAAVFVGKTRLIDNCRFYI